MSVPETREENRIRKFILEIFRIGFVLLIFTFGYLLGSGALPFQRDEQPEVVSTPSQTTEPTEIEDAFEIYWDVWNKVENTYYYDIPDSETRVYDSIKGLIAGLEDRNSEYLTPAEAAELRDLFNNSYAGIGAFVSQGENGGVLIDRVFDESPALKGGLQEGDLIIAVDDVDVMEMILDDIIPLVKGEPGTIVTLTVDRPGDDETLDLDITRDMVEYPSVETEILEGNIGHIILFDFYELSDSRMERAVEEFLDEGIEGLIIDVRGNGGGYLDKVVPISDLFLTEGIILIERDSTGEEIAYHSETGDIAEEIPLVILVDENSASASEILAGAVQDRERGLIIGQTTFGKGSIQTLYDLPDLSLLRISTGAWYTPNDESIQGNGITPDIEIELPAIETDEDFENWHDTQLEAAISVLLDMIEAVQ